MPCVQEAEEGVGRPRPPGNRVTGSYELSMWVLEVELNQASALSLSSPHL